ncbi:unnamed protein product [Fraxinus pennsylvanica]|uniref:Uncharacterized protein n=1 Tax=Fraxinus pennsylvanica TaxID=56036 RepID=A0AAD2A451_9LAMI|nr:unnamed protein product [Fraxinus pennsylvanica]
MAYHPILRTESLPLSQIENLFQASTYLEAPCHEVILEITVKDGQPPLCIISDVYMGGGAYGTAAYVSLWQHLSHRSTKEDEFSPDLCRFHISQLHQFLRAADGTDPWSRFFQPQISLSLGSFGWLCNSVEDIEPLGSDILR